MFAYCNNNPVSRADQTGKSFVTALFQAYIGAGAYIGCCVSSLWDEDIRNDMDRIRWNPFNADESSVLNSDKVSFYKGEFVVREDWKFTNGRSASFGIMFLNKKENSKDTVKHEYGHFLQLSIMGVKREVLYFAIPSIFSSGKNYYSLPWERSADMLGGVNRNKYVKGSKFMSIAYMVSCLMTK